MVLTVTTSLVELDGKYGLLVESDDPATSEFFEQRGLEGNGYTWNGVVESIARLEMAGECQKLDWSPEADSILILCSESEPLERLEQHIADYAGDDSKIESALAAANPEMMD